MLYVVALVLKISESFFFSLFGSCSFFMVFLAIEKTLLGSRESSASRWASRIFWIIKEIFLYDTFMSMDTCRRSKSLLVSWRPLSFQLSSFLLLRSRISWTMIFRSEREKSSSSLSSSSLLHSSESEFWYSRFRFFFYCFSLSFTFTSSACRTWLVCMSNWFWLCCCCCCWYKSCCWYS